MTTREKIRKDLEKFYGITNNEIMDTLVKCHLNYVRGLFSAEELDKSVEDVLTDYARDNCREVMLIRSCANVIHARAINDFDYVNSTRNFINKFRDSHDSVEECVEKFREELCDMFDNVEVVNIYKKDGELVHSNYSITKGAMIEVCRDGLYPIPVKYIR